MPTIVSSVNRDEQMTRRMVDLVRQDRDGLLAVRNYDEVGHLQTYYDLDRSKLCTWENVMRRSGRCGKDGVHLYIKDADLFINQVIGGLRVEGLSVKGRSIVSNQDETEPVEPAIEGWNYAPGSVVSEEYNTISEGIFEYRVGSDTPLGFGAPARGRGRGRSSTSTANNRNLFIIGEDGYRLLEPEEEICAGSILVDTRMMPLINVIIVEGGVLAFVESTDDLDPTELSRIALQEGLSYMFSSCGEYPTISQTYNIRTLIQDRRASTSASTATTAAIRSRQIADLLRSSQELMTRTPNVESYDIRDLV